MYMGAYMYMFPAPKPEIKYSYYILLYKEAKKQCRNLQIIYINLLTAGAVYIRVFIFYQHINMIRYHILNMSKIKCVIIKQDLKRVDLHFVKSE